VRLFFQQPKKFKSFNIRFLPLFKVLIDVFLPTIINISPKKTALRRIGCITFDQN